MASLRQAKDRSLILTPLQAEASSKAGDMGARSGSSQDVQNLK